MRASTKQLQNTPNRLTVQVCNVNSMFQLVHYCPGVDEGEVTWRVWSKEGNVFHIHYVRLVDGFIEGISNPLAHK